MGLARRHTEAVIMAAFLNMLKGAPLTPIIGAGAVLGGSYMVQNYSLITGSSASIPHNLLTPVLSGSSAPLVLLIRSGPSSLLHPVPRSCVQLRVVMLPLSLTACRLPWAVV